jgi:ribose 5-phosphate isomerase B
MRIIIGCDHAAFPAKEELAAFTRELGHEVIDKGTHSTDSCDYGDYAHAVADTVARGAGDFGILVCGTGIGMSLVANRVKGIRAALCHNILTARLSRSHNNANVLCMGARVLGGDLMKEMVREFLNTEFEGGRHARRIGKINELEG